MASSEMKELLTAIQKAVIEIGEQGEGSITTAKILTSLKANAAARITKAEKDLIAIGLKRAISQVIDRSASASFDDRIGLHGEVIGIGQTIVVPADAGGTRRILFRRATIADLKAHVRIFAKRRGISKQEKKLKKFLAWLSRQEIDETSTTEEALIQVHGDTK